jgi:hypothetical protein
LLIADEIAFVFIHWSIVDVPFIWTTSRFHHLSTFDYLSSPFSISGQSISNSFLVFFVAFLSHRQTSAFSFVFDMNTSVHVLRLEARPQFTGASLDHDFKSAVILILFHILLAHLLHCVSAMLSNLVLFILDFNS